MKKILILFGIVLTTVSLITQFKELSLKKRYKNFSVINYSLEKKNYKLLVADTPEKWQEGLMFFEKLDGVDGMIFLFPDKQTRYFWNKNTYLDLELLWVDESTVIKKDILPSIRKSKKMVTVTSSNPVNKVLELVR